MFSVSGSMLEIYVTLPQKQVTDFSLIFKDSDMESENLSSLIWFSVSDGQKTDCSKVVLFIGISVLVQARLLKIQVWLMF